MLAIQPILNARAKLLRQIRAFFDEREVLEVTTPILSPTTTTDPAISSLSTHVLTASGERKYYLHTSPEFPMKRLLASGSGSIFQICQVFRNGELGRFHQPEFSMLEWYRTGWDHHQLMAEVEALLKACLPEAFSLKASRFLSYRQAFLELAGLDPFRLSVDECRSYCRQKQLIYPDSMGEDLDEWLDLIISHFVQPDFDSGRLTFLYDYPASQAALARLRQDQEQDIVVAERFEVFAGSVELGNGFHELSDASEQLKRFHMENEKRRSQGKDVLPVDMRLIAALEQGLPDAAGVAIGLDRLLMLVTGASHIQDVMSEAFLP